MQSTSSLAPVPHTLFKTDALPASDRFDAWREGVSPLFDAVPETERDVHAFEARVESFNLNNMFFGKSEFSAHRFRRDAGHASAESDHFLVQLYTKGGYEGYNGFHQLQVGPGDISLLDLGQPLATRARASQNLSLVIPRELLLSLVPPHKLACGSVLKGQSPLGRILGSHLLNVWQNVRSASMEELEAINPMLLGAIVGAFAAGVSERNAHGVTLDSAKLETIQRYIQANLSSELTPDQLCQHFNCSRARLYRLFAPLGGVANYIRQCRLVRCRDELSRPGGKAKVLDIALRWGFSSHSHFCRLFKQAFGLSPSDVISQAQDASGSGRLPTGSPASSSTPEFHHWLRQLS
ncbi:helix-turn-helix domain-containing protein [Marinobacter nanhaiticus D15-8W]|uniref:Helix-turn-helix domain-containing protein n=1 Tax=Marinobacter nanhaiticus D15-8W TaxID=626887 RepID=N6WPX2_9GAMM|nr:helix-turn-helix domain-containing protein [Marinobacter nanhaiticus]ENO13107.1 helix-turn-helix domain-containing protein [Marinobacter nanhaiticus D15-8W]BES70463.1 helix-turn-helix domain-containing protein [Marinobacter nanhaiticus D15-8W]